MHRCLLMIAVACVLVGCGESYTLRGRVVESDFSGVSFEPGLGNDSSGEGISGAKVRLYRDAGRLRQELVVSGSSGSNGVLILPVKAFGAGWMEELWLVEVVCPGYESIEEIVQLPSSGDGLQILIRMREGQSIAPQGREDLWKEYERFR